MLGSATKLFISGRRLKIRGNDFFLELNSNHHKSVTFRFACPECQKYFNDKNKVRLHVQRVHKQTKNHNCDECEYKAHSKWDILRHMKAQHMPKETDPKDLRICPDCGKVLKVCELR